MRPLRDDIRLLFSGSDMVRFALIVVLMLFGTLLELASLGAIPLFVALLSGDGVSRFVASPENSRSNMQALAESGYAVEFLSQQSTPLFISLTKPAADGGNVGDGLTSFCRGGLWVTTRSAPRTFDVPGGCLSRVDLSWDPF